MGLPWYLRPNLFLHADMLDQLAELNSSASSSHADDLRQDKEIEGLKKRVTELEAQLLALEKEQSREFRAHYLGQEVEVLIEEQKEIGGKVYWLGHTDTYVKAAFAADSAECMDYSNRLVHGRAVSFLSDEVLEIALNF